MPRHEKPASRAKSELATRHRIERARGWQQVFSVINREPEKSFSSRAVLADEKPKEQGRRRFHLRRLARQT
jgi:hypothetical protein